MRFKEARDIRQSTLELNQLAEDVRLKAASAHTHSTGDIPGLQAALDAKASVTDLALQQHLSHLLASP